LNQTTKRVFFYQLFPAREEAAGPIPRTLIQFCPESEGGITTETRKSLALPHARPGTKPFFGTPKDQKPVELCLPDHS